MQPTRRESTTDDNSKLSEVNSSRDYDLNMRGQLFRLPSIKNKMDIIFDAQKLMDAYAFVNKRVA